MSFLSLGIAAYSPSGQWLQGDFFSWQCNITAKVHLYSYLWQGELLSPSPHINIVTVIMPLIDTTVRTAQQTHIFPEAATRTIPVPGS